MMERMIIIVEHVILQNIIDQDVINATLEMIISKQQDTEENIKVDARLLIGLEFYVVIVCLRKYVSLFAACSATKCNVACVLQVFNFNYGYNCYTLHGKGACN